MKGENIVFNFKSLTCYKCKSVMFNLPEMEVIKLNGLHFRCECCGHVNLLNEFRLLKTIHRNIPLSCINTQDLLELQAV
jgi:RNase P subunit RPR2